MPLTGDRSPVRGIGARIGVADSSMVSLFDTFRRVSTPRPADEPATVYLAVDRTDQRAFDERVAVSITEQQALAERTIFDHS